MTLTEAQRRVLRFVANGGDLLILRPGSNRVTEVEYLNSRKGQELFCSGDDIADLLEAGYFGAVPRDETESVDSEDDAPEATHRDPSYDPPHDAPCLFCGKPVTADDVRTHSLMYAGAIYAKRSYFYRTHRTCAEKDSTHTARDGIVLEMIAANGD